MFYTDEWAFVHIPKTSGNNILAGCREAKLKSLVVPWEDSKKYPRLSRHNPIDWWSRRVDLSQKEIYCVVRNPYSRAVSQWKHIIKETGKKISLHSFYSNRDMLDPVAYWLGQADNLKYQIDFQRDAITFDLFDCQKHFINDKVRPFKLESQLPELENKVKAKFITTTVNKGGYSKDYRYYYNDKTQQLVYDLFKDDFIEYGYGKDL